MKTIEIYVSGRVQGVCYRYFALDKANEYGIVGNVRNLRDGRVKIIARADASSLELFLSALRQGPALARIDNIEMSEIISGESFQGFRIEY
ncbi:MAG: acylphosphatase [Candidatus Cloacimonetes bacterium]|nr:acylphosphatase [Candidatus Cloacimonadota bacterium]